MKYSIKVVEIKPTKSAEWESVVFENVVDAYEEKRLKSKGWNPKRCYSPQLISADEAFKYKVGEVFPGKTIVTEAKETPHYEGQEPWGDEGLYYQNYIINESDIEGE